MQLVGGWALYAVLDNSFQTNFLGWNTDLEALLGTVSGSPGTYYVIPATQVNVPQSVVDTVPGAPTGVTAV